MIVKWREWDLFYRAIPALRLIDLAQDAVCNAFLSPEGSPQPSDFLAQSITGKPEIVRMKSREAR